MNLNVLIGNWESTGLLYDLSESQKIRMSVKLEILAKRMLYLTDQPTYQSTYGKLEILIFPLLRRICAQPNSDGSYTFYGKVNPLRVLDEFTTWFNNSEVVQNFQDINAATGIDVEAELVALYSETQSHRFRNDIEYNEDIEPITPMRYIPKHKL